MATSTIDACQICANSFNFDFYLSVSLPCGHAFCLLCLNRLRASGQGQCPTCRTCWAEFHIPALPSLAELRFRTTLGDEDSYKQNGLHNNCNKHSMPYDFWVSTKKEFYCKGCAAENPPVKLELIQNAIPEVKAALAAEVPEAKKKVKNHLQSLDEMHAEFVGQRNSVVQFMKAVQTLNDNLNKNIDQIDAFRSKMLNTAANLNKLERKVDSIKSTVDLHVAVECKSILEDAALRFSPPTPDLSQTLLFKMARNNVEEAKTVDPPSMTSFMNALMKGSPKPLLETVCAALQLADGTEWSVDIKNCKTVLLALADKQPYILNLIERGDGCKVLPVAALAQVVKNCALNTFFYDTYYSASNTATDTERLKHLLANKSNRLRSFYGHLDPSAIAELPHTVTRLGLAIASAAEAAAISGLRPWMGLYFMDVSVNSRVAVKDLKPLPDIVYRSLLFPFLTDANVNFVRPAIEALLPELG